MLCPKVRLARLPSISNIIQGKFEKFKKISTIAKRNIEIKISY